MWTSNYEPFSVEVPATVTLRDALEMLATYLPDFRRPGFTLGRWVEPMDEGRNEYVMLTQRGEQFIRDLHTNRWIRSTEAAGWHETARARELEAEDDPYALDDATPEELSQLLTACLELDKIMEGQHLLACCENGWFIRVVQRADALLRELPPEDRVTLMP